MASMNSKLSTVILLSLGADSFLIFKTNYCECEFVLTVRFLNGGVNASVRQQSGSEI